MLLLLLSLQFFLTEQALIKYLNNDQLAKQIEREQSMVLLSVISSSLTYLSASATYSLRNHGVISIILHHPTFWKISTMAHRFDFLFWKGWAKRDLIFYLFTYKDFKNYGWRNMEEFEKESERVSEAFTTMIRHGTQIEEVRDKCDSSGRWKHNKL